MAKPPFVQPAAFGAPTPTRKGLRCVLVGEPGFGKTTIASFAPGARIVMTPDEQGYATLHSRRLVQSVPCTTPSSWPQLIATVRACAKTTPTGTLAIDALGGVEQLCSSMVCERDFGGDWGEKGFSAWGRGLRTVGMEWNAFLLTLQSCADAGWNVMLLGHSRVKRFDPPDGPSYDRYECNVADLCWARTRAWAEAVLFGTFRALVAQSRPEGNVAKAYGKAEGKQRLLRCQYSPVADAKNQWGLQSEYEMPEGAERAARAFWQLILPPSSQGSAQ